jgi:hypothetical protein
MKEANLRNKFVKFGVVDSKTTREEILRSGFIFGAWTRSEMTGLWSVREIDESKELEYLENFLEKIGIKLEELRNLENDTKRLEIISESLAKQKDEFKFWFKLGLWTYLYTWLLGFDYNATETEEARYLIRENTDIRKAGSNFIGCLQDLDWSPDKIETFNLEKMIPFLWENDLRKWVGHPDMAVMSDLRYEAKVLDKKDKEDNSESRFKLALKELVSGIPVVGKSLGVLIFGNKK